MSSRYAKMAAVKWMNQRCKWLKIILHSLESSTTSKSSSDRDWVWKWRFIVLKSWKKQSQWWSTNNVYIILKGFCKRLPNIMYFANCLLFDTIDRESWAALSFPKNSNFKNIFAAFHICFWNNLYFITSFQLIFHIPFKKMQLPSICSNSAASISMTRNRLANSGTFSAPLTNSWSESSPSSSRSTSLNLGGWNQSICDRV